MKINNIKLSERSTLYFNLSLSIGFAFLVLLFRMKITHNNYYLFLVWNLFLAGIPFAITQLFKTNPKLRAIKTISFIGFAAWLLFLPNSPYIITDLVHLHSDRSNLVWLDLFLVFVFAFNGLFLGLLSMLDMFSLICQRYGSKVAKYTLFKVCILSGYGIYLGRFLRFNSWDITTKPGTLFLQMAHSFREPKVWLITFAFGGFLWILFSMLQSVLGMREANVASLLRKRN